jgi:hypothetical protein
MICLLHIWHQLVILLTFTKIEKFKEGGGDNLDIPETMIDQDLNDMEELISTNE